MPRYFVTGGSGFVGQHLCRRLRRDGASVHALARSDATATALRALGCDARLASLGDPNALSEAFCGCEVVFHCAAQSSHRAPSRVLSWVNVAGTENVVAAARHAGVRRVLLLSCADVTLTNQDRMSWKETRHLVERPIDALARTRLLAEELALQASDRALEVTALRPAWLWGPGELRHLPALCEEARHGRVSLCGAGRNLVSTTYVDNLIDALLAAATAAKAPGNAYHVLDAETLDARELFGHLCASLGLPAPRRGIYALSYAAACVREFVGLRGLWRTDVIRRGRSALFDGASAAQDLGYEPRVSVAEGMHAVAQWAKDVGGPDAIVRLSRPAATLADAEEMIRFARAAEPG